jgi:cytochrome c-type biogenesis protein CcmE
MTRKRKRLYLVLSGLAGLGLAVGLMLWALNENVSFFFSPSEVAAKTKAGELHPHQKFRVGGIVEPGSLKKQGLQAEFNVTDGAGTVKVSYEGLLPDLFREGQGVVTRGALLPTGVFRAEEVLAKHDEKYMPPEVVDALKKTGAWKEDGKTHDPNMKMGTSK